jgi:hypothetical protein
VTLLFLPDRIAVLNAPIIADDGHGNPVVDWDNAVEKTEPAGVQPLAAAEYSISGDTIVSRYKLILHPKTVATALSRIRWRGDVYDIEGQVQLTSSVTGRPDHREAMMRSLP